MSGRWAVIGWLAPVALVLLLVTSNVRLAAGSLTLYAALFERNHVVERTGITTEGLREVGRQVQAYFDGDAEPLRVTATVLGVERDLFGPDEVAHMADVKQLFRKTYRVQGASALFLAAVALLAVLRLRGRAYPVLARGLRRGSLLTVAVIAVLGGGSLVAFDQLFSLFHYLGFPQGNYVFDTRTDYLVRVFPFGFWRDITLFIGLLTLIEAAALYGAGVAIAALTPARAIPAQGTGTQAGT